MATINRGVIFGKLNPVAYQAVEAAYNFCKLRNNSHVEIVHWLHQIMQFQDSDLHRIIRHYDCDPARLATDITSALNDLPRGTSSNVNFSSNIDEVIEQAWLKASLLFNDSKIRTGHLLVGMLETRSLASQLYQVSEQFKQIKADDLIEQFDGLLSQSPEVNLSAKNNATSDEGAANPLSNGQNEALAQYTVDLTQQARDGSIDPVVGRDVEIRQLVDILMRRRQNNPILTGEAGVGKTAVVEGFALRIARGDVPPALENVSLLSLDIGLLQAGASMKGEFEDRLKQVIDEVQSSETPIILFIDEAHRLIGAGGAAGTGDAANLLKPALARGNLRTVAATTWAEYKKYIEKDPALTRRFQVVKVDEPSEAKALLMMRGVASSMEKYHQAQILDEALETAVSLSHRYIPARQLPDKSISLLDTACARVAVSQHAVPGEIDDKRKHIQCLETELAIIERESTVGFDVQERKLAAQAGLALANTDLHQLEQRWEQEKNIVQQVLALRAQLRSDRLVKDEQALRELESEAGSEAEAQGAAPTPETSEATPHTEPASEAPALMTDSERQTVLDQLGALQQELSELQGEDPLILPIVDAQAVASVVQDWTGIPVGRMVKNEVETVLNLADILGKRIIGQDHALQIIAKRMQTARANMDNPGKPIGVFMLAGSSGVGKTETALALAETLYGGEQNVITINMSEFQEAHSVSTLKGAPPGYVGYGEGGVLTEAVRRKPYSIVLLDEVEKAHPDVHEIFFQVFDKGVMEDGEGRVIDFKNTIILLTTNVGTELIMGMCNDPDLMPSPEGIAKALRQPLLKEFPAALLGRLVAVPYYPLSDDMLRSISELQLSRIQKRTLENHDIKLSYNDDVLALIVNRCTELDSGGRMIDSILTNTMLPEISHKLLNLALLNESCKEITVAVADDAFVYDYTRV